ncbi:gliding motility lipoprotein GldB [Flavobacterium sp. MK4S-17]|uniref:gliding motility lipoprotein GldB n=1 Tax=Flavobacterium sp. MK4S-17 TaxID=2543737 RepID=UPI00135A2C06|nr:gliding motility lipoprotein GldB [Flavobacterium sp. MK4S-17]
MKKLLLLFTIMLLIVSCKQENKTEQKIAEVPVKEVHIKRFDKIFFKSSPDELPALKKEYPFLFPADTPDEVWVQKMTDPFLKELYTEVQKAYPDLNGLEKDLEQLFQRMRYYYPELKEQPDVITLVSDDLDIKSIYTDNIVLIPLSLYLGRDNRLYEGLDKYQVQNYEPSQILPDIVSSFSNNRVPVPQDRSLLALMVYFGKQLYLKDVLLPDATDADKIGYTQEQIDWSKANEEEIWRYFVDEKILFDNNPKLALRFINPAPFSKFYLEVDKESPGRIGQWMGWQIVRAYMKNNEVTLQDMIQKDAKEIFDNSKYKPKK